MSNTSEINVYFRNSDLQSYNNLNFTPIFSDLEYNNIVGQLIGLNNLIQYSEGTNLNTFLSGIIYIYLDNNEINKKDSITAVLTTYNTTTTTILNPGFFIFQIIAGQGKYLGASGTVFIYEDKNLIRYFKIIVHY